jgi:hypothetical protein
VEVAGSSPTDHIAMRLCVKKWHDLRLDDGDGLVAGLWSPPLIISFLLFILSFFGAGPKTSMLAGA